MAIERTFKLFLWSGASAPLYINANQYDSGETWLFELYFPSGARYIPETGSIVGIKADGKAIANTGTVDSEGRVVIEETEQMTAAAGRAVYELLIDNSTHGTANFVVKVEKQPTDEAEISDSDLSLIQQAIDSTNPEAIAEGVSDWMDEHLTPTTPVVDDTLTVSGAAADAKATGDRIAEIEQTGGLTSAVKSALLQIAQKVAYIDEHGQTYYDDLYDALYPEIVVTNITLNQSSLLFGSLNTTQQLIATTTPSGGAVTWTSSNSSVATVSQTGLVTSAAYGNATITATSGGISATCSVAVEQATVTNISASYTQSGTVYDTDTLDSLKNDLVVTATWSSGTTSTVASNDYTLSGTLETGTSTITVSYSGKTTTFDVTVTHYEISIVTDGLVTYFDLRTAEYNNNASGGKTVIYSSDDNYSTFAWQTNGVSQQDAQKGILFSNTRSNVIATTKDGTAAKDTNSEWTEIILVYNQLPKLAYVASNNVNGIEFGAPYTDTNSTKKVTSRTSMNIGYKGGNGTYMPIIGRASATKFEIFDRTGEVVYTKNSSDISDFQSWVKEISFGMNAITNGWCMLYAIYDKALSDAQILQMVEYMESIEVME